MKNLGLVLLGALLALAGVWFSFELRRLGSLGDSENPASVDVAGPNTLLTCIRWTLLVKGPAKVVRDANRYSLVNRKTKVSTPNLVNLELTSHVYNARNEESRRMLRNLSIGWEARGSLNDTTHCFYRPDKNSHRIVSVGQGYVGVCDFQGSLASVLVFRSQ